MRFHDKLLEQFHSSYQVTDSGCWLWTGYKSGRYGGFYKQAKAHRWSYETFVGPIPDGKVVCHKCDTPLCVNPAHLWVGSQKDNVQDMIAKGRQTKVFGPRPWNSRPGDLNPSRVHKHRMPRGEKVNTAKLTAEQVVKIRELRKSGLTYSEIGRQYGVTYVCIQAIATGKSWAHIPM